MLAKFVDAVHYSMVEISRRSSNVPSSRQQLKFPNIVRDLKHFDYTHLHDYDPPIPIITTQPLHSHEAPNHDHLTHVLHIICGIFISNTWSTVHVHSFHGHNSQWQNSLLPFSHLNTSYHFPIPPMIWAFSSLQFLYFINLSQISYFSSVPPEFF